MQLIGTTRGGKRSQEVANPGSLIVKERKHPTAHRARRQETLLLLLKHIFQIRLVYFEPKKITECKYSDRTQMINQFFK